VNFLQPCQPSRATKAETRRLHLLDVSRRLFVENGFHGTGVAQIAAASGVKVGQIYRDFDSKEDIVAAITEADLAAFLDEGVLTAAVESGNLVAVRGWIERFFAYDEPIEECRMMTEISAEAARNPRIADLQRSMEATLRGSLAKALTALAPASTFAADRARLFDLIMVLGIGLINRRIVDPAVDLDALVPRIRQIVDAEIAALVATGADA
jgi:AcrR family transcriptional regulator